MPRANELYHYGILGMRWGLRRYHNKYGSLTNAGHAKAKQLADEHQQLSNTTRLNKKGEQRKLELEKRYSHLTGKLIKDHESTTKQKKIQDMSNEELAAYNYRKQLESTYMSYQPKQQVSKGKEFIQTVATKVVAPVAIDIGKKYLSKIATDAMNGRIRPTT